MNELVFLLEEESARVMLQSLLPRILDPGITTRFIVFEGKQDLEKNLARKIRGYRNTRARFLILRDQDSNPNCQAVKQTLQALCSNAGRAAQCLVRIACRELETFYLADLAAVDQAMGTTNLRGQQEKEKFRALDRLSSPSRELASLTNKKYQKVSGSRAIGAFLNPENPSSPSFWNLIAGIRRLERDMLVGLAS
uniref:DUF4276 domain-containing protein n=1 Tax=mine drainage metagenome TaxID=410659 RepID=E6QK57_9ZZZZ